MFDLHVHTNYSPDSNMSIRALVKSALKRGLSGIAITDHETVKGGLAVRDYCTSHNIPLQVIVGQEKKTNSGEILALFVEKEITARDIIKAIGEVRAQNGLLVLPHPLRNNPKILSYLQEFDFIEGFNSRTLHNANLKALELAKRHGKKVLAGSDAHFPREVGKNVVIFTTIDDIKNQLLEGDYTLKFTKRSWIDIICAACSSAYIKGGSLYLTKQVLKKLLKKCISL